MVFTLTAAMLVGTPLAASAAPLNSVFSISDGAGNTSGNTETPTQTVTNTDTETETSSSSSALKEYEGKILGITLDQSYVTVVADQKNGVPEEKRQKITATVVLDSFDDPEVEKNAREALNKKIKWEVFHYDGSKAKKGDYFPSQILTIKADASDRSVVTLNPQHANKMKAGEEMIVRASIDGRYYYHYQPSEQDGDKKVVVKKELGGKEYAYQADAKVFVKEYSEKLWFDWNLDGKDDATDESAAPTAYFKHTLDLSKYLARDPETANDTITWTSDNTKAATVNAAGVVTFKQKGSNAKGKIFAVSEKGKNDTWEYKIDEGVAASKIEIFEVGADGKRTALADLKPKNAVVLDLGKAELLSKNFEVKMYAKVEAAVARDKVNGKEVPATSKNDAKTTGSGDNTKYVIKKLDIEDGKTYFIPTDSTKKDIVESSKPVNVTDELTWTTNKTAFAVVTNKKGKLGAEKASATVEARGLGKAAITVKASNGKSAKFTADVKATMGGLEIVGAKSPAYSGQSIPLTAKKLAISNDNAEIQNKDAVKWYIAKGGSGTDKYDEIKGNSPANKALLKNVKINNKGVLTISNKLDANHLDDIYVGLRTAKNRDKLNADENDPDKTKPYYAEPVKISLKQSSIDEIYVYDGITTKIASVTTTRKTNGNISFVKNSGIRANDIKKNTTISIPKGKTYTVVATPSEAIDYEAATTLNWKTSNAKVVDLAPAADGKTITITAKAKGNATITVSGICVDKTANKNAKVISTNFKITVEQPATSLTLKKTHIVMKPKNNASVSVAAVLNPKGFRKTDVTWKWRQIAAGDNDFTPTWVPVTKANRTPVTAANASVKLESVSAGDVFEIKASIPSGYAATCRVEVVKDTKKLALVSGYTTATDGTITVNDTSDWVTGQKNNKNKKDITLEETVTIKPLIDLGTNQKPEYHVPGTDATENTITYTVNKKNIVNIVKNEDGTVTIYPVGYGKVTITAKTALNKSSKVTIEVIRPANQ